jgi:hypothetical protein
MKGYLEDTLHELYKSKGIYRTKPETWKNDFPVLSELRAIWERDMNSDSVRSNTQRSAEALFRKTSAIGLDGSLSYLNKPPKEPVDFSRGLIVFDISGVDEEIKPAMNVLVTGMLGSRFRTDLEKETIIVVDEARVFLRNEHLSTFLLDTVAMGRSYGIALWLITQNPGDLAKNGVEEEFRTNMPLSIVMGATLDSSKVGPIQRYFNLSETAVNDLLQCDPGDGLLLMRGEEIPLKFEPTAQEYEIIKGCYQKDAPAPIIGYGNNYTIIPEFEQLKRHHGVILKEWIEGDDSVLSSEGWEKVTRLPTVTGRGSCTMWVPRGSINGTLIQLQIDDGKKKLGKMTVEHFACVVQIESMLTQKGIKCSSDHNREADIIFEIGNKIYAIEYEKAGTRTIDQLIDKKGRLHSFDDFRFVCSSKDYETISRSVSTEYTVTRGKEFVQWIESLEEPLIKQSNGMVFDGYLTEEGL